ncbi:hypothetical protein V8B55DRAFT_1556781, partial [Mucor lusitanicus]
CQNGGARYDDIVCLLSSPANLDRLHSHLQVLYSAASKLRAPFGLGRSFCFREHRAQQILCQAASFHCVHFGSHTRPLPPSKISSRDHRQPEPGQILLAVSQTGPNPTRSLLCHLNLESVSIAFPLDRTDDFARCHPSPILPYHLSLSLCCSLHF